MSLRKNGLTSLFKEVRAFKERLVFSLTKRLKTDQNWLLWGCLVTFESLCSETREVSLLTLFGVEKQLLFPATCYRTEKAQIPKSAGESAGKSAGKEGTAGGTAGSSAGRPDSLEKQRNGTAPSSPLFPGTLPSTLPGTFGDLGFLRPVAGRWDSNTGGEIITELILKRAGPVIFNTFLLELLAFRPIPVICLAGLETILNSTQGRSRKKNLQLSEMNSWKRFSGSAIILVPTVLSNLGGCSSSCFRESRLENQRNVDLEDLRNFGEGLSMSWSNIE